MKHVPRRVWKSSTGSKAITIDKGLHNSVDFRSPVDYEAEVIAA